MEHTRDHSGKAHPVHPEGRLVTDFKRLLTDVDRMMVDINGTNGGTNGKARDRRKPNGHAKNGALTLSALRQQAHWLVKSLEDFENVFDQVPLPVVELDEKARILRINEEFADAFG